MQEKINTNFISNGCLNDCIGYILNRHPTKLPLIYRFNDWENRLMNLFEMFGYNTSEYITNDLNKITMQHGNQYIACGYIKKTKDPKFAHAIVIDDKINVLYDRRNYNKTFEQCLPGGIYCLFEIKNIPNICMMR